MDVRKIVKKISLTSYLVRVVNLLCHRRIENSSQEPPPQPHYPRRNRHPPDRMTY